MILVVLSGCSSSTLLDLTDECIRNDWATLLPTAWVVVLAICSIRYPRPLVAILRSLCRPWKVFLSLSEAEAYELDGAAPRGETRTVNRAPLWFTLFLVGVATLEVIAWTVVAAFTFVTGGKDTIWCGGRAMIHAVTWVYAATKPILNSKSTPSYDLLALYALHLIGAVLVLGGTLYEHNIYSKPIPRPVILAAYSLNLATVVSLLFAMVSRPVAMPSSSVNKDEIVCYHWCFIPNAS